MTGPLQTIPHYGAQSAGLVPGDWLGKDGGMVTDQIEPCKKC